MDLRKLRSDLTQIGGHQTLPQGWRWTTLEDICLPVSKVRPRDAPDQSFTYLDIASIDNSLFQVVSPKEYWGKDAPSRARQRVRGGNTLFSTVRTYLKNIALVPPEFDGEIASTGFCVLNPSDETDDRLIFYFVQADEFVSRLNPLQRGTSYPAVRDDDVRAQPIPLPPVAEQHRIVAEIEKHFTRLDAAVAALKRAQANLKRYRAGVLKAACEGKLVPTEAELARAEGRDYQPAGRLLERILAERRARWQSGRKAPAQVQRAGRAGHLQLAGTAGRVGLGDSRAGDFGDATKWHLQGKNAVWGRRAYSPNRRFSGLLPERTRESTAPKTKFLRAGCLRIINS